MAMVVTVLSAARATCLHLSERRWGPAFTLATAALFVLPTSIARVSASMFVAGLATFLIALLTLALLRRRPLPDTPAPPRYPIRWGWVPLLIMTVLVIWGALDGYWWDEDQCHFGATATLARGMVPPEHPLFPGEPFRYHYGFNSLAGLVRAFTGCNVAHAIDAATLWCFALLLITAHDVGGSLGGKKSAFLAMLLVPLGAGALQFLLFQDMGTLELHWSLLPISWRDSMPPPVISNFFQHPQGLGMGLALGLLLFFETATTRARLALYALLLGSLALAHIVFFAVMGLALGAGALMRAVQHRRPATLFFELTALLAALGLAWLLGGFFAQGPGVGEVLVWGKSFFVGPWHLRLAHNLVLFGLPLLLLPAAALRFSKQGGLIRGTALVAAFIGFVVPHLVSYERSWDIVKFLGIGAFFAQLLLADTLSTWRPAATFLVVALSTNTGWLWLARMSALNGRAGVPAMHFGGPSELGRQVGERLYPLLDLRERVFSTNVDLARASGILTPGFAWQTVGQGFLLDRPAHERLHHHAARARQDLSASDLEALEVTYLVLSPGDEAALSPVGKSALQDPARFQFLFEVAHQGDRRRVYRVGAGPKL